MLASLTGVKLSGIDELAARRGSAITEPQQLFGVIHACRIRAPASRTIARIRNVIDENAMFLEVPRHAKVCRCAVPFKESSDRGPKSFFCKLRVTLTDRLRRLRL